MITDILKPVDDSCADSLDEIQKILSSDTFLAGLGILSHEHPIPTGFNVITDFQRANYLLTSQEMWDKPKTKPKERDQNFADVIDDSVEYLGYPTYERQEAKRRMQYFKIPTTLTTLSEYILTVSKISYGKNEIAEFLKINFQKESAEDIDNFIEHALSGYIETSFNRFIRAAYFGGLQNWPVCEHMLQCYAIGGFPTGWIGPLPKKRGKPENCLQILHFGPEMQ